jgi:hypothetical protein
VTGNPVPPLDVLAPYFRVSGWRAC